MTCSSEEKYGAASLRAVRNLERLERRNSNWLHSTNQLICLHLGSIRMSGFQVNPCTHCDPWTSMPRCKQELIQPQTPKCNTAAASYSKRINCISCLLRTKVKWAGDGDADCSTAVSLTRYQSIRRFYSSLSPTPQLRLLHHNLDPLSLHIWGAAGSWVARGSWVLRRGCPRPCVTDPAPALPMNALSFWPKKQTYARLVRYYIWRRSTEVK